MGSQPPFFVGALPSDSHRRLRTSIECERRATCRPSSYRSRSLPSKRQSCVAPQQFSAVSPQSQARIRNEEYLFALDAVVAIAQHLRIVAREHGFEVAICKAHAFNFFFAEMPGAQPDREAAFGRAMNEVSSRTQVASKIRIRVNGCERSRSSAIAILSDQRIDSAVFAKLLYTGCEDNQLGVIGQCHSRAVDGFVAEPCAVKFIRIEINDSLLDRGVHRFEVHFQAQLSRAMKTLGIVADEKTAHCQLAVLRASNHGQYVH